MVARGEEERSRAMNGRTARSFVRTRNWVVMRFAVCLSRSEVVAVRRGEGNLAGAGDGQSSGLTVNGGGRR